MINLALGTAQFGSAYGITNQQGMPTDLAIDRIFETFLQAKLNFIDTAKEYGQAHQILAQLIKKYNLNENNAFNIITKICINNPQDITEFSTKVKEIIAELNCKNLYGILIHNPTHLTTLENLATLNEQFKKVKELNLVKRTGISIYAPRELLDIYSKLNAIDIIQCPANIFDQRFLDSEFQVFCKKNNIEIHARSLFLQGLLLVDYLPEQITDKKIVNIFEQYQNFLKKNSLSKMQACSAFMLRQQNKINRWIVGFNAPNELEEFLFTINQVNQNIDFDFSALIDKNHYIDPRTWEYKTPC